MTTAARRQRAHRRLCWLDSKALDPSITPTQFRMIYLIACIYYDHEAEESAVGDKTLARALGISTKTVNRLREQLVGLDILGASGGCGRSNLYRYTLKGIEPPSDEIEPAKTVATRPNPNGGGADFEADFERFWAAYPRKVDKGAARKTYLPIVRNSKATPAELLDRAERYAQERAGQDPRYTKHPKTWLNAESWKNEPEQPAPSSEGSTMSAMRGIYEEMSRRKY
jgi:hypothetical protein